MPSSMSWSRPSPPSNGLAVERADVVHDDEVALAGRRARRSRGARMRSRSALELARRRPRRRRRRSRWPTSRPLYVPSVAFGRTPISIAERQRLARAGRSPTSSVGSPTGWTPAASIASTYQRPASRGPPRRGRRRGRSAGSTTGGGHLALAEAGHAQVAAELAGGLASTRRSISSAGTSASTRTRDSGSSVTVALDGGRAWGGHDSVGRMAARAARPSPRWMVTGPLGHLYGGVADADRAPRARDAWARARERARPASRSSRLSR